MFKSLTRCYQTYKISIKGTINSQLHAKYKEDKGSESGLSVQDKFVQEEKE